MPLIQSKSKKAFDQNMKSEMRSGKPQDQSLAIAYSIKRQAKKKMAHGGEMMEPAHPECMAHGGEADMHSAHPACMAHGGEVMHAKKDIDQLQHDDPSHIEESYGDRESPKSIVEALMSRRKAKKMADGGMVDIEENGEESSANPNSYDEQNEDAGMKELYDDAQLSSQPEDSNEHGDEIDSDEHDMVSKIRSKMKLKRGM